MLSPVDLWELERVCRNFRALLNWRNPMTPRVYLVVAERFGIPLPDPYTYRRVFSLLAGLHCEFCGRPSNQRPIRVYWMFGILCCRPCFNQRTTDTRNVAAEQLNQLVPIQTLFRGYRGRVNPVRPRMDRFVWTEHLEVYLPGATPQERLERLAQLQQLERTMLDLMQEDPRFEVLRQRQTLQRNPPRRSTRLQQRRR